MILVFIYQYTMKNNQETITATTFSATKTTSCVALYNQTQALIPLLHCIEQARRRRNLIFSHPGSVEHLQVLNVQMSFFAHSMNKGNGCKCLVSLVLFRILPFCKLVAYANIRRIMLLLQISLDNVEEVPSHPQQKAASQ